VTVDRQHLDLEVLGLENDFGAHDRAFAEPAVAKPPPAAAQAVEHYKICRYGTLIA
jgi:hypothetical protein